jgi:uncharacterized protein YgiB involved in biofilm formation
MSTQIRNKFTVVAATVLLTLMLTIAPARAHHDHDFVAPLIAGFVLGALVNYDHSSRHYYHYQHQRHGHYRQGSGHRSGHGYSHGYRKHYQKSHSSYGHYSKKRRHNSSHGGYYKPRRKH